MSESLYRKYRPQVFGDVVGQDHIIKTLQNSISANKVSHAYLFCGPRGTGKTTTARILAKALLCEKGPCVEPDGTCESCQLIAKSLHPDVSELDAASRTGVENVRDEIISRVGYAPVRGDYKVYVIDEVHMLSNAAFNALLKTLEEPPSHIVFVLCTTDPQKVPETIRSRCQRFDFRPINTEELTGRLGAVCEMENVPFEGEALELIARRSNGGLRDALTALEQTIAFGDNKVTLAVAQDMFGKTDVNDLNDLVSALAKNNINKCLEFVNAKVNDGVDLLQFGDDFAQRMRDVYVMKLTNCDVSVSASDAEVRQIEQEAKLFDEACLRYTLLIIRDLVKDLRTANNQRLVFELGIFKMLDPHSQVTLEAIDARLTALEGGVQVAPKGSSPVQKSTNGDAPCTEQVPAPALASITGDNPSCSQKPKTSNLKPNEGDVLSPPAALAQSSAPVPKASVPIDFRSVWKRALEDLRTTNPAIYSLLDSAHGSFNQPSKTITLKLEAGRSFAYNNLGKPASKDAILSSLEKAGLLGAKINVVMLEGDVAGTEATSPAPAPNPSPTPHSVSAPNSKPASAQVTESAPAQIAVPVSTPAVTADDNFAGEDIKHKTCNLKPKGGDAPSGTPIEPEPGASETGKTEIDEFNDILSSTFGEGTTFREV